MPEGERRLGRGIDYLGAIARMLRDLTGFSTLAYELIQNADDAPGATAMSFDVGHEALVVWNDGQFEDCGRQDLHWDDCPWRTERGRRCDFHSFRSVSGGDKGFREDTTGAFGIGFTAVYQVTDLPELISSGQHWFIDETLAEQDRIRVHTSCEVCQGQGGTRFILPWATNPNSAFRRLTGSQAVQPEWPAEFFRVLEEVVPTATLFLRKIRRIDLLADGELRRSIRRQDDGDDMLITDGRQDRLWRILRGDFEGHAQALRSESPESVQKSAAVSIALPLEEDVAGVLCAYLPTEERTGLPFHVNADFYPVSDRKHLLTEGYQGQWNRAAINGAARSLAAHLEELPPLLGHRKLWALLLAAYEAQQSAPGSSSDFSLGSFWDELAPLLSSANVMLTSTETWAKPSDVAILREREEAAALPILEALGLRLVHTDLREYCFRLPWRDVLGISMFGLRHMAEALRAAGLTERIPTTELPPALATEERRALLWRELELLLTRSSHESRVREVELGELALAPGSDGALWPFQETYRADPRTTQLFNGLQRERTFLDTDALPQGIAKLVELCPEFTAREAIDWLTALGHDALMEAQSRGPLLPDRLLGWLARRDEEILGDETLCEVLIELPVFPSHAGPRALSQLALPGNFTDPLGLADIVAVEVIPDQVAFLRQLGAKPLTFFSYVLEFLPRAIANESLTDDQWRRVVPLIATKLGEIEDEPLAKGTLSRLPLVECEDEVRFRPGSEVYFSSPELTRVLGDGYPSAAVPAEHSQAVRALYEWLGVASQPRPLDLLARISELTAGQPGTDVRHALADIVAYLGTRLRDRKAEGWEAVGSLRTSAWLPARGDTQHWYGPKEVCTVFQDFLFSSQGRFLDIPRSVQTAAAPFLEVLGVRTTPTTTEIVRHLLYAASQGGSINREVYTALNQRAEDPEVGELKGKACILAPSGQWLKPQQVFWGDQPFGRFRASLGQGFQAFVPLLFRLGVKDHPDHEDAAEVLMEMAAEFGFYNSPIENPEDQRVFDTCWRMLDDALERETIDERWLRRMNGQKVIRDPRNILMPPARIFFEDVPGLAEQFPPELQNHLIRRPEGAWRAMRAAGVRDLSAAVATHVVELGDHGADDELRARVRQRVPQLGRVFDPVAPGSLGQLRETIDGLTFVTTTDLQIRHTLQVFHIDTDVHSVSALFLPAESALYVAGAQARRPWLAIAKELVRALIPDVPPGTLAPSVALVLEASSPTTASEMLDEAGIPRLTEVDEAPIPAHLVEAFGGNEALSDEEWPGPSMEHGGGEPVAVGAATTDQDHEKSKRSAEEELAVTLAGVPSTRAADESPSAASGPGRTRPREGQRVPTTRGKLRSYVAPSSGESAASERDAAEPQPALSPVDLAGVARVLAFERAQGRDPREMPHGFPGYDVESLEEDGGVERYIEVKSMSGVWDSYGAALSRAQFRKAQELGERYWLYIVERAEHTNHKIRRIQDPARKVDQFFYDDGWVSIAEA
jgi:Domain of unknown function (DUF3883)